MLLILGIMILLFLIVFVYSACVVSSWYSKDEDWDYEYYENRRKQKSNNK